MLVSTSGTTTHETSTPPTPPDTPKYLDQRSGLASWGRQRIERAPLGLATPEPSQQPLAMTRSNNLCPHQVLMQAFRHVRGLPGKRAAVERASRRVWAWPRRPPLVTP
jgi:hypothetical protein